MSVGTLITGSAKHEIGKVKKVWNKVYHKYHITSNCQGDNFNTRIQRKKQKHW